MGDPESEIKDARRAMALGIKAGKALLEAENALSAIRATAFHGDRRVINQLYAARLKLNALAREISICARELEDAQNA